MKLTQKVILGILTLIIVSGGTTIVLTNPISGPSYDVCKLGSYGTWENISAITYVSEDYPAVGQYRCELENSIQWCKRTTATRCYLLDVDIEDLTKPVLQEGLVVWDSKTINYSKQNYDCVQENNFIQCCSLIDGDGKYVLGGGQTCCNIENDGSINCLNGESKAIFIKKLFFEVSE